MPEFSKPSRIHSLDRFAQGILFQHAQFFRDGADGFIVALRFSPGLDAFLVQEERRRIRREKLSTPISSFSNLVVDRQDNIGKLAIIFHPGMLGQHELDLGASDRPSAYPVAIVPAGHQGRGIRPDHMDLGAAFRRILVLLELVFDVSSAHKVVPYQLMGGFKNGFVNQ